MKKGIVITLILVLCVSLVAAKVIVDTNWFQIEQKLWVRGGTTTPAAPAANLTVDIEGSIGATQYCDSSGVNCITIPACQEFDVLYYNGTAWACKSGIISAQDFPSPGLPGRRPLLNWPDDSNAVGYQLWLSKLQNDGINYAKYDECGKNAEGQDITCSPTLSLSRELNGRSEFTFPIDLKNGQYRWWVRSQYESGNFGAWSEPIDFTINAPAAGKVTLTSPSGSHTTSEAIRFDWQKDTNSSWYYLYINKGSTLFGVKWINSANSFTYGSMPAGTYTWWIRSWNIDGNGPWSDGMSFTIS